MPLLGDATQFLLHQQHQFTLVLTSKPLHQYLTPNILNDNFLSEKIIQFYLQSIPPVSTIAYLNRLKIVFTHNPPMGNFFPEKLLAAPKLQEDVCRYHHQVDIPFLAIQGHLRRLICDASSMNASAYSRFGSSRSGRNSMQLFQTTFIDKVVRENRVHIVELRLISLLFPSIRVLGQMISALAGDDTSTRTSLEILDFSSSQFDFWMNRETNDEDSNDADRVEEYCLVPGMKRANDLTKFSGLIELNLSSTDFSHQPFLDSSRSFQKQGYFCFELLPSSRLEIFNISNSTGIVLHPAYESGDGGISGGGLDYENIPQTLTSLDISRLKNEFFCGEEKELTRHLLRSSILDFAVLPPRLQVLKANQLDAACFGGGSQHLKFPSPPSSTSRNFSSLRELSLVSNSAFRGPLDLTSLPPSLEILSLVQCRNIGTASEPLAMMMLSGVDEKFDIVDLTQLPKNMKCLRLDWCNLKTKDPIDLTRLPESLEVCSLSQNHLVGGLNFSKLPSTLRTLSLGHNNFSGEADLRNVPKSLTHVDLSSNKFSGLRMRKEDMTEERGLKVLSQGNL